MALLSKKTPSGLDADQLANERGIDVVKDKAKISKKKQRNTSNLKLPFTQKALL